MDGIVLLGRLLRGLQKFQANEPKPLALEAAGEFADQPALYGVGLEEDEGRWDTVSSFGYFFTIWKKGK